MSDTNTISLSSLVRRNDTQFIANKLGDEMVMMNMDNGDFISMNNVGADIWDLSGEAISVRELVLKLQQQYSITEEQCLNETIAFLQTSREQNMFTIQRDII